ncbi:uncharacterized protein [Fopius arisanus]|uniref:Cytochrome c oxidase subunit 6A1, mitochondrial n=1 Tax=Fopius arisanus TaxID=64838 RepID=A0A9R1TBV0_9HYME|nr:PREDICTED: uncharacterized protein LOC105268417 [Fopius arisanus]
MSTNKKRMKLSKTRQNSEMKLIKAIAMSRIPGTIRGLRLSAKNLKNCKTSSDGAKSPCDSQCPPPCPCPPEEPSCSPPPPPTPICPVTPELQSKIKFWKYASLFGAAPGVLIMIIVTTININKESENPRPPYKPMEYMYKRNKRFPWGDGNYTLFHNPERNPVPPDGYEVPDPAE